MTRLGRDVDAERTAPGRIALTRSKPFIVEAVALLRRARAGADAVALKPMRLFHFSNSYLALLFCAIAIDPLLF